MPSSSSSVVTVPASRALRKCGSSGMESSEQNAYTALVTFPTAHSRPRSGPP